LQKYSLALIFNSQNVKSCDSKPAHRQGPKVLNHQVPNPLVDDQPSPSQEKSPQKYQDSTETAESSTNFSTSSSAQIHADPVEAPEQTVDALDQGMSSAIVPKQATTISPQGKIIIIKSLPMNFYTNTIVHPQYLQLKMFHRQPRLIRA